MIRLWKCQNQSANQGQEQKPPWSMKLTRISVHVCVREKETLEVCEGDREIIASA